MDSNSGLRRAQGREHVDVAPLHQGQEDQVQVENGRYLLADAPESKAWDGTSSATLDMSVYARVRELEDELAKSQEQIGELKMLVAIYEEKLSPLKAFCSSCSSLFWRDAFVCGRRGRPQSAPCVQAAVRRTVQDNVDGTFQAPVAQSYKEIF